MKCTNPIHRLQSFMQQSTVCTALRSSSFYHKMSMRKASSVHPGPEEPQLPVKAQDQDTRTCAPVPNINLRYVVGVLLVVFTASGLGHQISHMVSAPGTITLVSLMAGERLSQAKLRAGRPMVIEFLVLVSFTCSWLFAFTTILFGLFALRSVWWCRMGLWACAFLYASNKLVVYIFLMAKVHLVTCPKVPHIKDPVLRRNALLLLPYGVILVCVV